MFGISYVTFVFCIMYYAPNRLLPGCACYWFTPTRYYQLISCINWPLVPAQNRGSPKPAASSETAQKTETPDSQKLPAQWVWKTAQLGGKTAELATLVFMILSDVALVEICWINFYHYHYHFYHWYSEICCRAEWAENWVERWAGRERSGERGLQK